MSVKVRSKNLAKGKISYYLDIYHNGERNYEFLEIYIEAKDSSSVKKEKKKIVEAIRAQRELDILGSEYGYTPNSKNKIDFIQYFKAFLDSYEGADKRLAINSLIKFIEFLNDPKDLKEAIELKGNAKLDILVKSSKKLLCKKLTPKICEDYSLYLKSPKKSGLSGETPYNYFSKFKKVIKTATRDGYFQSNPCEGISVRRETGQLKKNVLEAEELSNLNKTECTNKEVKRAFLFSCLTGLGIAEIRSIRWSNIKNDKVDIKRLKTGKQILNDLPNSAIKLLGKKGKPKEHIFNLPSDTAINKGLKVWIAKSGIDKHITFYCARHTFAVLLLSNGANLKTIADAMGHTSTRETSKYLNYINPQKSEALKRLPNLN